VNLQKKDQEFTPSPNLALYYGFILDFKGNLYRYHQEHTCCRFSEGRVLSTAPEDLADDYVA